MAENDTKIVITAVDQATGPLNAIGNAASSLGVNFSQLSSIAAGFTAVAAGGMFASMISGAIDAAGELHDLSQKTGASVESLSALKGAARSAGIDLESLGGGLSKLSKNMLEAAGGTGKAGDMFAALGVSIKNSDGSLRDSNDVMLDAAKGIAGLQSGTERAAAAQVLFGKSGANMVPLLLDIADKIELVGTVTAEQAARADEFGDNMIALGQAGRDAMQTIANEAIPVMLAFSRALIGSGGAADSAKGSIIDLAKDGSLKSFFESAGRGAAFIADAFGAVIKIFQATGTSIGALAASTAQIWEAWKGSGTKTVGEFASGMGAALERAKEINRQSKEDIKAIWSKDTFSATFERQIENINAVAETGASKAGKSIASGIGDGADKAKKKVQELIDVFGNGSFITKDKDTAKFIADQYKAANEMASELVIEENKRADAAQKVAEKNGEIVTSLQAELEGLSLSSREREISLALAKLTVDATEDQRDAVRQLAGALHDAKDAAAAQDAASKAAAEEWKTMWGTVEKTGHDVFVNLFSQGKSAWEGIGKALKASVLDLLYQMTAKKWIISIGASMSGGASGMAAAAGGSGSMNYMASSMSGLFNGGMSVMGDYALGAMGLGSGLTQGAMLAAQTSGFGLAGATATADALGGIAGSVSTGITSSLSAIGPAGWAAIGAAVIFSMISESGGPKVNEEAATGIGAGGTLNALTTQPGSSITMAYHTDAMQTVTDSAAKGIYDLIKSLGGNAAGMSVGMYYNTDPHGTAPDNVSARLTNSSGDVVYNHTYDTSRGNGQAALADEYNRLTIAAVQSASGLPPIITAIAKSIDVANASAEQLTAGLNHLADASTVVNYTTADLVKNFTEQSALANRSLMDVWRDSGSALNALISTYDGSVAATKTLSAATQSQYQLEMQLIGQINNALTSTHSMFSSSAESIRMSVMDNPQKYDYLRSQADALYQQLATASDPVQIQKLSEQINKDINDAYGLLNPEQQKGASGEFISYLEKVDALTTDRLTAQQDIVVQQHNDLAEKLTESMDKAAAKLEDAAAALKSSAETPPPPLILSIHSNASVSAEVGLS